MTIRFVNNVNNFSTKVEIQKNKVLNQEKCQPINAKIFIQTFASLLHIFEKSASFSQQFFSVCIHLHKQ